MIPFKTVCTEAYGSWDEVGFSLVENADDWKNVWERLYQNLSPMPPLPKVDFGERQVLVYRMGSKPNGGHAVSVEAIRKQDDALQVDVIEQSPGAGCMTTMAIVSPFVVVSFPKTNRSEILINRKTVAKPCN